MLIRHAPFFWLCRLFAIIPNLYAFWQESGSLFSSAESFLLAVLTKPSVRNIPAAERIQHIGSAVFAAGTVSRKYQAPGVATQ
jgi:hypothetical protein